MLYPHQEVGVEWLCKTPRGLLADDQGLGKTIQVVVAAKRLGCRRVLVVAPAAVTFNWRAEFVKWASLRPDDVQVIGYSGEDVERAPRVVVVAHSMLFREPLLGKMRKERFDVVAIDEAHYFRTPGAKRTLALYSGREAICRLAPRSWALTGTPLPNGDPAEVWTMLAGMAPERIRGEDGKLLTWGQWRSRFAVTVPTIYGDRVESLKNLPELNRRLAGFMLRRLKKNVLTDLPPIRWSTVALDSLAIDRSTLATVDREDGEAFATWRHNCGVAKVRPTVELLKTELEGGLPCVVVFAQHVEVLDRLCDGLAKYRPLRIDGTLSAYQKAEVVNEFQRDGSPHRVIVVQLQSGGVGITLTRASDVVFVETSSVPGDMAQCADRVHRIGQKSSVLVRILALAGTVDEVYADALARKSAMVSEVMRASEQNR
jgi:SWI/SNF-related matrix-associated actin-dependent regulator 1 of chromatin subfamily A